MDLIITPRLVIPSRELKWRFSRSSGPGGQKVNKTDSRVEIIFNIEESKVLKVTEFISANDLAKLMDVTVNDVISKYLEIGMFVSINQRLDAETMTIIAEELGELATPLPVIIVWALITI